MVRPPAQEVRKVDFVGWERAEKGAEGENRATGEYPEGRQRFDTREK